MVTAIVNRLTTTVMSKQQEETISRLLSKTWEQYHREMHEVGKETIVQWINKGKRGKKMVRKCLPQQRSGRDKRTGLHCQLIEAMFLDVEAVLSAECIVDCPLKDVLLYVEDEEVKRL